jgi:hypothetical protein
MRGDKEVDVHSPITLEPLLRAERTLQERSKEHESIEAQDHKVLRLRLVGRLEFLRLTLLAKGHLAVRAGMQLMSEYCGRRRTRPYI